MTSTSYVSCTCGRWQTDCVVCLPETLLDSFCKSRKVFHAGLKQHTNFPPPVKLDSVWALSMSLNISMRVLRATRGQPQNHTLTLQMVNLW